MNHVGFVWPIRWKRPWAWSSLWEIIRISEYCWQTDIKTHTALFHQESLCNDQRISCAIRAETYTRMPLFATVRFRPSPPAFNPMIMTWTCLFSENSWTARLLCWEVMLPCNLSAQYLRKSRPRYTYNNVDEFNLFLLQQNTKHDSKMIPLREDRYLVSWILFLPSEDCIHDLGNFRSWHNLKAILFVIQSLQPFCCTHWRWSEV